MKQSEARVHVHFDVVELITAHGERVTELTLNPINSKKLNEFKEKLTPGQVVDVFYDANKDDGTLAQLAKIHACIKQIASDSGNNFEDLKLEIKKKAGLCIKKELDGDLYMICKSFSKCSKEELALAINATIELGDFLGSNVR
jgi:hypothetical protein